MAGLSTKQLTIIRTLIDSAPDGVVTRLDRALTSQPLEGKMAEVRDLVGAEIADRKARNFVFQPFIPMCPRVAPTDGRKYFPFKTIALLWTALNAYAPDKCALARASATAWTDDDEPSPLFDNLCADAAAGLRFAAGTCFAPTAAMLDEFEPNGAEVFASYLDLAPLGRTASRKLPDWLVRMTEDRAVTVKLTFRDSTAVAPDAAPRLLEILAAQLEEPCQILRVIAAMMDHPGDNYMAASELGFIGARMISQIERRLDELRAFDPWEGEAAGRMAAAAVTEAVELINEFERSVELSREGPWGYTILKDKRELALCVEKIMGKADDALAAAMPLKMARFGKGRGQPRYDEPPVARAQTRAQGLMVFVSETRGAAPGGGFASFRNKMLERLDDRIDHYVEDVLEDMRDAEHADQAQAAVFAGIAAVLVGLLRGEKAAQIVRRRAAV